MRAGSITALGVVSMTLLACTPTPDPLSPVDAGCIMRTFCADPDGDGVGNSDSRVDACTPPVGYVERSGDNCPSAYNPGQDDADGDGTGNVCDVEPATCQDLTESPQESFMVSGGSISFITGAADHVAGARALRFTAASGEYASVAWTLRGHMNVSSFSALHLAVRAANGNNPSWQTGPVVVLQDADGHRRSMTPVSPTLGVDGSTWQPLRVPLAGGGDWVTTGDVDLTRIHSIEIGADTWGAGFILDLDAWTLVGAQACEVHCPLDCSGQGTCDPTTLTCNCELGATGPGCAQCEPGFSPLNGHCDIPWDAKDAEWPNSQSSTNGDAWLRKHHDEVQVLRPRVVVLDFVNVSTPERTAALVGGIVQGFADSSRPRGTGEPQLQYDVSRIVDLRDGVSGRPRQPANWPYENSTLLPRRAPGTPGQWSMDYAALFSQAFAPLLGIQNPDGGGPVSLCTAVERGLVNELWLVVSGDVPDVGLAEVLESKQRYTAGGHLVPGSMEPCAGNGCFDPDVPHCARSIRIGTINYNRGPGCYLHSLGHGLEGTSARNVAPDLASWFRGFAGFDLDTRYGLPVQSLYGLTCSDPNGDGVADPPCLDWLSSDSARLHHLGGTLNVSPFDPLCGNVHFPPNATWHYDYAAAGAVMSSCSAFGRPGAPASLVDITLWQDLETRTGDCGGGFLTWWFRQMPAAGSGHRFPDGRAMKAVWPFLFL